MNVFSQQNFLDPDSEFRPLQIIHRFDMCLTDPEALTGEEGIDNRLDFLKSIGMGGVVCNVGFRDYLQSERQWEIWDEGVRRAADRDMILWWYDEKGYPSGTAGGLVTRADPTLAALGLACYTFTVAGPKPFEVDLPLSCLRFEAAFASKDFVAAAPDDVIDLSDHVDNAGRLEWDAPEGDWTILYVAQRYMYEGTHSAANVCEFKHYVNLLEPEATERFLRVTHEQYFRRTPPEIWKRIRAVFTDEPSLMVGYCGPLPERYQGKVPVIDAPIFLDRPVAVPWSKGFAQAFRERKGYDVAQMAWCLYCGEDEAARAVRHDYYEVVTDLYADGFYRQTRQWCDDHGIAFSGHVMAEEWLTAHVEYHGSLFAPVRQMSLPGIDMLDADPQRMLNGLSFLTAKQVSSVAHLTGAKQVHSECSDWSQRNEGKAATLAERCGQGNLLYVMGVNMVTSYWSWDIGDEAARQYNDYMGRIGSLLQGGVHRCDVAVLYPIRSAWLDFVPHAPEGHPQPPQGESGKRPDMLARRWGDVIRDLVRAQIDLDCIDEQALIEGAIRDGRLHVADESFRVVVLPGCEAISAAAAEALEAFGRSDGLVVSVGAPPRLGESAEATERVQTAMDKLFNGDGGVIVEQSALASHLAESGCRTIDLAEPNPDVLCTQRELEGRGLCFIVNANEAAQRIRPSTRMSGPLDVFRPEDGSIAPYEPDSELVLEGFGSVFLVERRGS